MKFRIALPLVVLGTLSLLPVRPAFAQQAGRAIVNKIAPQYPELARPLRLEGTVKITVQVAPNGSVKSMKAVGGNPLLLKAAQDAVDKWKWAPTSQESSELVELHFKPE